MYQNYFVENYENNKESQQKFCGKKRERKKGCIIII